MKKFVRDKDRVRVTHKKEWNDRFRERVKEIYSYREGEGETDNEKGERKRGEGNEISRKVIISSDVYIT